MAANTVPYNILSEYIGFGIGTRISTPTPSATLATAAYLITEHIHEAYQLTGNEIANAALDIVTQVGVLADGNRRRVARRLLKVAVSNDGETNAFVEVVLKRAGHSIEDDVRFAPHDSTKLSPRGRLMQILDEPYRNDPFAYSGQNDEICDAALRVRSNNPCNPEQYPKPEFDKKPMRNR
jgi:hypothetical protein